MSRRVLVTTLLGMIVVVAVGGALFGQLRPREQTALAEPFRGVTTDGHVIPGLFKIEATGVSTTPVRQAAKAFLASLTADQRRITLYPADDLEWRKWHNVHRAPRQGVSFGAMSATQKERAFELLRQSLSAEGLQKTRHVMRLNEHLAELIAKHDEYGEEFYFITMMGEPSEVELWGWQLDGHHLVINYFILGDQVIMSPSFMGSEPVVGSGAYAGIAVMQDEQNKGLELMASLAAPQQQKARLVTEKGRSNALAQAFNDNLVLDYAGLRVSDMDAAQQRRLLDVVAEYVFNMDEEHARVRMNEVEAHLDQMYFAWIGDTGPDGAFYYRIHSPVILIEFDHQGPIALDGSPRASRRHVHSVVRTPNGNDYGKDLLRQHYEAHRDNPSHRHELSEQ